MPRARRFTDDQIRDIRQSPLSARELAQRYDASHPTILDIRSRRTYKDVPDHVGSWSKNKYVLADAVSFLADLPNGYCGTAITSPPIRRRLAVFGGRGGRTRGDEQAAEDDYVWLQRRVIEESLRIVGSTGVLFYHQWYEIASRRGIETRQKIIDGFPLRQVVIWNHQMRWRSPRIGPRNQLPNDYGMIYIFAGSRWEIPHESVPAAMVWGDVWDIRPDPRNDFWGGPSYRQSREQPYSYVPAELADRCVALGSGMVLDPQAGTGSTVLAAIRAGRDWLACGADPSHLEAFEMRRSMMM